MLLMVFFSKRDRRGEFFRKMGIPGGAESFQGVLDFEWGCSTFPGGGWQLAAPAACTPPHKMRLCFK